MSILKRFSRANQGSVVIYVAVTLVLLLAILAITIDLGRVQSGSVNNQAGADAATLAAAEYINTWRVANNRSDGYPSDLKDYILKVFKQNLSADQSDAYIVTDADITFVVDQPSVTVNACLTVNTPFANTTGNGDKRRVCNTAQASLPGFGNIEVVFALDISGSMTSNYGNPPTQKLAALKQSVHNLIDAYPNRPDIFWGVVPFTGVVDLGNQAGNIVADDKNSADQPYEYNDLRGPPNIGQPDSPEMYMVNYGNNNANALTTQGAFERLVRFPLTSRLGGAIDFTDDRSPAAGGRFEAYWHHPYDYWYREGTETPADSCGGSCRDKTTDSERDCVASQGCIAFGTITPPCDPLTDPNHCVPPPNCDPSDPNCHGIGECKTPPCPH